MLAVAAGHSLFVARGGSSAPSRVSVDGLGVEQPKTADELASTLGEAAAHGRSIDLGGCFTKRGGAGPVQHCDLTVSTSQLNRILAYEPRDLTISVEAGITYADLTRALAPH